MFSTILFISYAIIVWFSAFAMPLLILLLVIPALMFAYTYLYAYIASFFLTVEGGNLACALTVYNWFSYCLIGFAVLIMASAGKKTKSGELDKRYSKQNAEDLDISGKAATPFFLVGLMCIVIKYGFDKFWTYIN
ncbi:hypothetical protein [Haemophilus parainfluenzae]|uniref:hypothetical protein n=1 Tax=Haemophilus parainfluenzae TaxID=729 RepID=UPI0018A4FD00|nr:hypothetical protein [Haemophilus parainfluenzae]QOR21461.1 hypothetical protein INP92_02135 [Haemophilus parainfluenzae]